MSQDLELVGGGLSFRQWRKAVLQDQELVDVLGGLALHDNIEIVENI